MPLSVLHSRLESSHFTTAMTDTWTSTAGGLVIAFQSGRTAFTQAPTGGSLTWTQIHASGPAGGESGYFTIHTAPSPGGGLTLTHRAGSNSQFPAWAIIEVSASTVASSAVSTYGAVSSDTVTTGATGSAPSSDCLAVAYANSNDGAPTFELTNPDWTVAGARAQFGVGGMYTSTSIAWQAITSGTTSATATTQGNGWSNDNKAVAVLLLEGAAATGATATGAPTADSATTSGLATATRQASSAVTAANAAPTGDATPGTPTPTSLLLAPTVARQALRS